MIKVTLKGDDKKAIAGQKITFTFNGKTYTRTTNKKGVASLTINAAAGKTYKFSYKFAGTSYYNRSASGTINLAVKLKTSLKNSGTVLMNNTTYVVSLKDSSGNLKLLDYVSTNKYETTMDIEKRILRKITVEDTIAADEAFSKLMGDEVEPRKDFITKNSKLVADLDI